MWVTSPEQKLRRLHHISNYRRTQKTRYEDFQEPDVHEGLVLVEAVAGGVYGTDVEIVEGEYGLAPPGKTRLVVGNESLGRDIDPGSCKSF